MSPRSLLATTIAVFGMIAPLSRAQIAPYTVDANTLHLWHLDQSGVPAADEVIGGTALQGLLNGATLGNTSYAGFGTALNTNTGSGMPNGGNWNGGLLLAQPALANDGTDNVAAPFAYTGAAGEFTFEALVRLDVAPGAAQANLQLQIMSMDDDVIAATRVFHFRINDRALANLEFLNFNTTTQTLGFALPLVGPHALDVGDWYHAAVTYNGVENTADNLAFYWTKLNAGSTSANLLGTAQMTRDLTGVRGDFALGNEARASSTEEAENFPGLIDEVRISGVARAANEFIFVPEPSTGLLAGAAGFGFALRRRRRSGR